MALPFFISIFRWEEILDCLADRNITTINIIMTNCNYRQQGISRGANQSAS